MINPLHEQIIKEAKDQLKLKNGPLSVRYQSTTADATYESNTGSLNGTLRIYQLLQNGELVASYQIFTCRNPMIVEGKFLGV